MINIKKSFLNYITVGILTFRQVQVGLKWWNAKANLLSNTW